MNKQSKSLLVVGGTGFIGHHVVQEAKRQGFQITILSKNDVNFSHRYKDVAYISADISDKDNLLIQLKDKVFNYVINLAGYIDHSNFSNGGENVFNAHFNGLKNLIYCLNKSSILGFVQIGSSDEYGNNKAPQQEHQREDPISPYSSAKVAATHYLQSLFKTEKFPVVILRLFLVYGPGQSKDRFIPQLINGCKNNSDFPVSDGEKIRDFCYVSDVVNAILISLESKKVNGEVINIASGFGISIKEIVDMLQNIIGSGNPIYGAIHNRPFENMKLYADITKAKRLINWEPKIDIKEGLIRSINLASESGKN